MTIQEIQNAITYPNRNYNLPDKPVIATVEEKQAYVGEWTHFVFPQRGKKDLPARLQQIINKNVSEGHGVWRYAHIWYADCIFYKGDITTTNDWLFITNGGGSYKVGAKYCIWETRTWIDRVKFPYSVETIDLKDEYLYLGCERGPMRSVTQELAMYYFGLNYLGKGEPVKQIL